MLDDIRALNRVNEIPSTGEMCELLWNDPDDNELKGFKESERGVGKYFGEDAFEQFIHQNNLNNVIRAH